MRTVFVSMCIVLILSLTLCMFSMSIQLHAINELSILCEKAASAVEDRDSELAARSISHLSEKYDSHAEVLEYFASHDDLHEVYSHLIDARICLEFGDLDDVSQALAQLSETLGHIRAHERFSLKNLI